ncbi:hypothetical protein HQ544_02810 [Candidatus Falkowbacteria bacterium]|nr:hypothetical protein [Candidatus Falkowbacteria bacterium]
MDKTKKQKSKLRKTLASVQIIIRAVVALIIAIAIYSIYGGNYYYILIVFFLLVFSGALFFIVFKNIKRNH